MNIEKLLQLAVEKGIINEFQRNQILQLSDDDDKQEVKPTSTSTIVKVLYYIGGFIMLIAMTYLMGYTVTNSSYLQILVLGVVYCLIFWGVGEIQRRKNEKVPAEILYFLLIPTITFVILDIEKMLGIFPHFSDFAYLDDPVGDCHLGLILLSICTIITSSIVQKFRNFASPVIYTVSSAYTLYLICYERIFVPIANFITNNGDFGGKDICIFSIIFFAALLLIAFIKDKKTQVDYPMWLYFFGATGFINSVFALFILLTDNYNLIQNSMLLFYLLYGIIGILIRRKVFLIICILGIIEFFIYYEFLYFSGFPILFTSLIILTGLGVLYVGTLYNQNSDKISRCVESMFSEKIINLLPQNRK